MATTPESIAPSTTGTTTGNTTGDSTGDSHQVHTLPAIIAHVVDELRARREAHAARLRLMRELSTYSSAADLDDLYATLDRYDGDPDAEQIRAILGRVRAA